jgi:heterodisulfide reductase subunit C
MGSEMQAIRSERSGLNFAFREKLNSVAEGFPAGNYSEGFNPRLILLKAILGFEDELISAESEIWDCTNCYTCSERCPQDVRPIDVIIALKNICVKEGKAPAFVGKVYGSVLESGITTKMSSLVEKRREEFGLAPLKEVPVEELKKMMGLD